MSDTPNLSLPYLAAGQAQKHVTLNESLRRLDAIVQLSVLDRSLGTPPTTPPEGVRYLVPTGAGGAWAGHANEIAAFQDGGWLFYAPRPGWCVYVQDESLLIAWSGTAWNAVQASINPAPLVGVNTSADATNRLAVKSDAVLLGHDDVTPGSGDIRVAINKAQLAKTASLLFQTGYSGRAEIGTAGDDRLRFKVSADGANWTEALCVDGASGAIGIGTSAPEGPLHILRTTQNPIHERIDNSAGSPAILSRKARGTPAAKAAVIAGDAIQSFSGFGHDGMAYALCSNLRWVVEGTVSAGKVPTRIEFWTAAADGYLERARLSSAGNLGIGVGEPSTRLHVSGPVRFGSYTVAGLPSASTHGAGATVYVPDAAGGAVLAFSDGQDWRRVTDRSVVN